MSYTDDWDDLNVLGSTPARDIDDKFRLFKRIFEERLPALIKDVTADPWEPLDELAGVKEDVQYFIGGSEFRELNGSLKTAELNPNFLAIFRGSSRVIAPVKIPVGVTLSLIEFLVNRGSVTNYTWRLIAVSFDTSLTETVIATNTDAVAGVHVHSQALTHTIADGAIYYVDIDTAGAADTNSMFLYGVRLTGDIPSNV